MPHTLACASTGADCPAVFTVETEAELWDHIGMHVSASHPELAIDDETKTAIGSMIVAS